MEPAGRVAIHVSLGLRAAAADRARRDRSPSARPGSATAAPAEPGTQVKALEAGEVPVGANLLLSKLQREKAALSPAGAQLAAGFWSHCLTRTESALRTPQRALHPSPFKKNKRKKERKKECLPLHNTSRNLRTAFCVE